MHHLVEKATYSPEDNKLRLYVIDSEERFEQEVYERIRQFGFQWAPIQRLFVAHWSVGREDLLVELAGQIVGDDITMVERAEAKAERLLHLSDKRENEASALQLATSRLSSTLGSGQPILVGHHSERRMRKAQDQLERNQELALEKASQSEYWNYRAQGVVHHANFKSDSGLRLRRIETLLKDLRKEQRYLNHAYAMIQLWNKFAKIEDADVKAAKVTYFSGAHFKEGRASYDGAWRALNDGNVSVEEVIEKSIALFERALADNTTKRRIIHLLNRLDYERYMLGPVHRFEGKLTATIIKTFARKHGTDSPECKKVDGQWTLSSSCPLPVHLGDGLSLSLTDDDWRDLMCESGYSVPAPKPKAAPILNFKAESIRVKQWSSIHTYRQIELTKAEYANIYSDYRGCVYSECGTFRVKVCRDPKAKGFSAEWFCVLLTDSKQHEVPESNCVVVTDSQEVA